MALNYDIRENKNAYREISKEEYYSNSDRKHFFQCPKIQVDDKYYQMTIECNMLIMLLGLSVGIPELTIDNYEIVYNRINLLEKINGDSFLKVINPKTQKSESYYYTLDMVKKNIGIKTNGISLSRYDFEKKILKNIFDSTKKY